MDKPSVTSQKCFLKSEFEAWSWLLTPVNETKSSDLMQQANLEADSNMTSFTTS